MAYIMTKMDGSILEVGGMVRYGTGQNTTKRGILLKIFYMEET